MDWMILPLRRYADFNGRSSRMEFWMFFLFQIILQVVVIVIIIGFLATDTAPDQSLSIIFFTAAIWVIFGFATFIPNMAVIARRFHDQNMPGIVGILLYLGTIIFTLPGVVLLIFMIRDGDKGNNQHGPDPKASDDIGDVFR